MTFLQLAKPLGGGEDSKTLHPISQAEPITLVSSLHFKSNVMTLANYDLPGN